MSPTLALCVIARNEERFIADCIDSAKAFVDEIVVVDTGSTDRTRDIAHDHGARVEHFTWCDDFAAARNAAIELATTDWILMLDADERLASFSKAALRGNYDALCPVIENRRVADNTLMSTTSAVPRLFPRRRDIRFVGTVHEVVKRVDANARTRVGGEPRVRIVHYGYDPQVFAERGKDARNAQLLERALVSDPTDARLLFFQLQQHVVGGRDAAAVGVFDRLHPLLDSLPKSFAVEALSSYVTALTRLDDTARVHHVSSDASLLGDKALQTLATYYASIGDLERAIVALSDRLRSDLPQGLDAVARDDAEVHLQLAELHDRAGHPSDALCHLESAYTTLDEERRPAVAVQSARYALRHADADAVARWTSRVDKTAPHTYPAQREAFDLAVQAHVRYPRRGSIETAFVEGDLQTMYDHAFALPACLSTTVRIVAVVEQLQAAGEPEAALSLLNRALEGPRVEQVYWLLVKTFTDLNRFADAQLALQALQAQNSSKIA